MAALVLIADDEPEVRNIFREELGFHEVTVLSAADGVEALDILKANETIAVLLTDVRMPRMDGYELAEKAMVLRPSLRVLMMSGYSQDSERTEALRLQGIQTVFKPMALASMADMVLQMLKRA